MDPRDRRRHERAFWGAVGADEARRRGRSAKSASPGPISSFLFLVVFGLFIWGIVYVIQTYGFR